MSIQFDCWNKQFKSPFGAISVDEMVTLTLHIPTDYNVNQVLVIVRDDSRKSQSFELSKGQNDTLVYYTASFSLADAGIYFYRFEIHLESGDILFGGSDHNKLVIGDWLPEFQLTVYAPTPQVSWGAGSTMYQIFPDRFKRSQAMIPGAAAQERIIREDWGGLPSSPHLQAHYKANDFFMGNLLGITEQLDYLSALHVNILYLNPIFESADNHRYSTSNYLSVDPYLGTNEDFEYLATCCHKKKMKLLLDGVFNHTGSDSLYFNRDNHYPSMGAYQSTDSTYYDWFYFHNFPNHYASWWGFETLPKVNTAAPSYHAFILEPDTGVLNFWQLKGADGYRLDVVDELSDTFLDAIRTSVKSCDSDALIIGEVWEDASTKESYNHRRRYLLGKQLDSVMNYPWRQAIIDFVQLGNGQNFYYQIMHLIENYPPAAIATLMNILSTHDTPRILTVLGESESIPKTKRPFYELSKEAYNIAVSKLYFASFLQFTLPGIPCIYYGDEVGLQGFEDPFCRLCYPYGNENIDLLTHYQKLSAIRHTWRGAFSGSFQFVHISDTCIGFMRENLYCICNLAHEPYYVPLTDAIDCLFANVSPILSPYGIIMPPESFCILKSNH